MNQIILDINQFLRESLESNLKLVVGIEGYSGIGKTTISNKLAELNSDILLLHMDDYVATANTPEKLEPQINSKTDELNLEWKEVKKGGIETLRRELLDFRGNENDKKILAMEGIFLFHPNVLRGCFDKIIYIDGDENLADRRRVEREKERWGDQYFPEDHPNSYSRLFKLAWGRYKELYKPKENADFVVKV